MLDISLNLKRGEQQDAHQFYLSLIESLLDKVPKRFDILLQQNLITSYMKNCFSRYVKDLTATMATETCDEGISLHSESLHYDMNARSFIIVHS